VAKTFPNDTSDYTYVDYFREYGPATWTVGGVTIGFPVVSVNEEGGNRLVPNERPYRDGAKYGDTGSKPRAFSFEAVFDNGLLALPDAELVLNDINGNLPLYPNILNDLCDSFDFHETGDLFVPTRGKVRARADSYSRNENANVRNNGRLQLRFVVDNEDSLDASGFLPPAVSASAIKVAKVAEAEAEKTGAWDGSIADLMEMANNIEGLANAPGDFLNDVQEQAGAIMAATDKIIKVHTDTTKEGRNLLSDPESSTLMKHLSMMKEMAGMSIEKSRRGAPVFVTRTYKTRMSIFDVAAAEGQDAATLMGINPQLEDPLDIAAGIGVRVAG
jgi:prophage DNA circulation protein